MTDYASNGFRLNDLATQANQQSRRSGWWDELDWLHSLICDHVPSKGDASKALAVINRLVLMEKLTLVHSEISEAVEDLRKSGTPHSFSVGPDGKPEGFGAELSDATIRLMDIFGEYLLRPGVRIPEKMEFNATRPYRHGKLA